MMVAVFMIMFILDHIFRVETTILKKYINLINFTQNNIVRMDFISELIQVQNELLINKIAEDIYSSTEEQNEFIDKYNKINFTKLR